MSITAAQAVQAADKFSTLTKFISSAQLHAISSGLKRSEGEYFLEVVNDLTKTFNTMPVTYDTEKQGDQAIAYFHFFTAGDDWYITERDVETEQLQAFGYRKLHNQEGKMAYISIVELIQYRNAEIDFHWEPKTLAEIKGE